MATTSARSAAGTANLSSVCATSSMNASRSPDVMRRCRCELSMSLPVYFCGPPAAQHSISVTRYLKPAGGTLWCASSTKGLALSRGSVITRSMRSYTTVAMLSRPPSRSERLGDSCSVAIGTSSCFRIQRNSRVWRGSGCPWPPLTVTHFAKRLKGTLRPLSTLTDRFADTDVAFGSILLKKSFLADERNFLAPLVRPTRGDVRDHIDSHKSDRRSSYLSYRGLQRRKQRKTDFARFSERLNFR